MDEAQREMTLQEWLARLPDFHQVNKEYAAEKAELQQAREEIELLKQQITTDDVIGATAGMLMIKDRRIAELEARVKELETLLRETEGFRSDAPSFHRTFTAWWCRVRNALNEGGQERDTK